MLTHWEHVDEGPKKRQVLPQCTLVHRSVSVFSLQRWVCGKFRFYFLKLSVMLFQSICSQSWFSPQMQLTDTKGRCSLAVLAIYMNSLYMFSLCV